MKTNKELNYIFVLADVSKKELPVLTYANKTIIFNNHIEAANYLNIFPYLKEKSPEIIAVDMNRLNGSEYIYFNDLTKNNDWSKEKEVYTQFLNEINS